MMKYLFLLTFLIVGLLPRSSVFANSLIQVNTGVTITQVELDSKTQEITIHYTGGTGPCAGSPGTVIQQSAVGDSFFPLIFNLVRIAYLEQSRVNLYSLGGICDLVQKIGVHHDS